MLLILLGGISAIAIYVMWFTATAHQARKLSQRTGRLPTRLDQFVRESLQGMPEVLDVHMHAAGMQTALTGCTLHPDAWSWKQYLKSRVFCWALGMKSWKTADQDGVEYLLDELRLANKYVKYRGMLLAMDACYDRQTGEKLPQKTTLEVPTRFVQKVSAESASAANDGTTSYLTLLPTCSVNPYRTDAVEELARCHREGIRMVKWLPNSQFMDPGDEKCIPFYEALVKLNMVLLCHIGEEHSVAVCGMDQSLGDPRRLRLALDMGVTVIMAHCGSEGKTTDGIPNFNLFVTMMQEPKYAGKLYGDVSAIPAFRRCHYLKQLQRFPRIHPRLLYGSDYPVPCIPLVPLTLVHWWHGLITWRERRLLNELYSHNVLLFNLVMMRRALNGGVAWAPVPPSQLCLHAEL